MISKLYTIVAVALFALYYIISRIILIINNRRFAKSHGCEPATKLPQNERLVGFQLLRQQLQAARTHTWLELFQWRFKTYGPTFSASLLGRTSVCTIEPENVKAILATNFKDYEVAAGRDEAFSPLLGHNGIFTADGKAWEAARALLRPSFTKDQISDLVALEVHVSRLISLIPKDNGTVDLQPLFFRFTLDSSTEFLFGESVCSLEDNDLAQQTFTNSFEYAIAFMIRRYRLGSIIGRFYQNAAFRDACKVARDFVDGYVAKALERQKDVSGEMKGTDERYIFLGELSRRTKDPDELRSAVLNILLAGRDTTASLLSNTFLVLAQRPDIWAELKTEVHQLDGARPTYATLKDMKYLRSILNESLRLYPVIPANSRVAIRPTVLPTGGGASGTSPIFIPKGTAVFYQVYHMHRRTDIFGADAEDFKPERWETLRTPAWAYLPFNGGPRVCLGQQYALTEAAYTIVRLVQEFETIDYRGGVWREQLGLSLATAGGVHVGLGSRAAV